MHGLSEHGALSGQCAVGGRMMFSKLKAIVLLAALLALPGCWLGVAAITAGCFLTPGCY